MKPFLIRMVNAAMGKRKRKTLPKDFGQLLDQASFAELVAVFDACELEATGGYSKSTALGFYNCPDELVRWLVEQGADINARDTYQRTPLHHRSSSWIGGIDLLLDLGADIEAQDYQGYTPLHAAANRVWAMFAVASISALRVVARAICSTPCPCRLLASTLAPRRIRAAMASALWLLAAACKGV